VLRARDRTRERDTTSISQVVPSPVELPDASVARRDGRDRLTRILDATDESERRVFVLAEMEGLRGSEIAEILELKVEHRLRAPTRRARRSND
jgi:DNA-directed RNA polymerase specialized sigma24 family protein